MKSSSLSYAGRALAGHPYWLSEFLLSPMALDVQYFPTHSSPANGMLAIHRKLALPAKGFRIICCPTPWKALNSESLRYQMMYPSLLLLRVP